MASLEACRSNHGAQKKWDGQPTSGPIWATEQALNREKRGRSERSHRISRSFSHFSDRLLAHTLQLEALMTVLERRGLIHEGRGAGGGQAAVGAGGAPEGSTRAVAR